jgi:hypothetical protein
VLPELARAGAPSAAECEKLDDDGAGLIAVQPPRRRSARASCTFPARLSIISCSSTPMAADPARTSGSAARSVGVCGLGFRSSEARLAWRNVLAREPTRDEAQRSRGRDARRAVLLRQARQCLG